MIQPPPLFDLPDRLTREVPTEWQWRVRDVDYLTRIVDNFALDTWDVVRRADPALWHLQIGDYHVRGWGCALQVPKHEMNIDRLVQWLRENDTYAVHGNKKEARRKEGKKLSDRARSLPARKTLKTYEVAKDAFQQAGLGRVASDGLVIGAPKRR